MDENQDKLIDAKAATSMLGVKPQTLYAYVSRGLIRTAVRKGGKGSLYHREDVEAVLLKGRKNDAPAATSERVIRWGGHAILQTSITSIDAAGPRYRGKLAVDLAQARRPFEDCVELLWSGILPPQPMVWQPPHLPERFLQLTHAVFRAAQPTDSMRRLLALTAEAYAVCNGRNAELAIGAPALAGRQLIQVLAPAVGALGATPRYVPVTTAEPIATTIARSMGARPTQEVLHALDACLILSADHELSPATFAARIAASAGTDLFSCVNTALGAFDGQLTGSGCDDAEQVLRTATSPKAYLRQLEQYTQRKQLMPGYDHPLYPAGDPRARFLVELARTLQVRLPRARLALQCIDAAQEELGVTPNLAMGLIAMAVCLDLPVRAPGALMALGRIAGWVAHAFEQRLAGFLVRPRARYTGPAE